VAGAASQRIMARKEIASQVKGYAKTIDLMRFMLGQANYSDEV
jgi:hypothetical protein